jgi:proteic killer suppression protein
MITPTQRTMHGRRVFNVQSSFFQFFPQKTTFDIDAADELLAALDAATSLIDLSPLKSVGLHKLSGNRAGQWAMTVNGPWRICFRFKNGNAYDVEITDYHKG